MHTLSHLLLHLIQAIFGILSSSSTAGPIYILLGMSTCGCESLSLTHVALKTVLLLSRESKLEQVLTLPLCFKGLGWDFLLFSPCCQALPSKQTLQDELFIHFQIFFSSSYRSKNSTNNY